MAIWSRWLINVHCDALQQQLWWQGKGPAVVLSKSTAIASITFLFIAIVQLLAEACSCWIEGACHSSAIYARKCLWEMCTAKVNSSRGRFWMGAHSFPPLTWIVEHNNRQWISTIDCNNNNRRNGLPFFAGCKQFECSGSTLLFAFISTPQITINYNTLDQIQINVLPYWVMSIM